MEAAIANAGAEDVPIQPVVNRPAWVYSTRATTPLTLSTLEGRRKAAPLDGRR
jgi:hypothetical protein